MKFNIKNGDPTTLETQCLVLGIFTHQVLSQAAQAVDKAGDGSIQSILKYGDFSGKAGQTHLLYGIKGTVAERILLVGCGKEEDLNRSVYGKAVSATGNALAATSVRDAVCCLPEIKVSGLKRSMRVMDTVIGLSSCDYRFEECKGTGETDKESSDEVKANKSLKNITLFIGVEGDVDKSSQAMEQAMAIADGIHLAKDLGNLPGNICTPKYLADQAVDMLPMSNNLRVEILEEAQMEKLGMGALLSVSKGSRQPAKLIVMEYRGGKDKEKPVVLVGKGLTFDAGGISLKSASQMDEMKYDMCGGASVLGAMRACLVLKLPINLVVLVPTSENMPDGDANKPGDIVTSMSGQTIEILNTDAEGRLILCDTLTYAERFDPAAVIDVATLTGACVVALGSHVAGMFSDHEELANEVLKAGEQAYDRVWRMPLWEEYQDQLDSNFADMANIGGRYGGAITAACFLSRYTKKYPWVHLDIAGVAWQQGKDKGSTGRPVALLTQFLLERCQPTV